MPYVNVQITRTPRATASQKAAIIRRMTDVLVEVLGKNPETTFVVIEEIDTANWGLGGVPVSARRARPARRRPTRV